MLHQGIRTATNTATPHRMTDHGREEFGYIVHYAATEKHNITMCKVAVFELIWKKYVHTQQLSALVEFG